MRVAVLTVKQANAADRAADRRSLLRFLERSDLELIDGGTVTSMRTIRSLVRRLSQQKADIFLYLTLSGRSAQILEMAVKRSPVPCVIWAIDKGYALASSALAIGAVRQSVGRGHAKLIYGPLRDPRTRTQCLKALRAGRAFSELSLGRIGIIGKLFPNLVACRYDRQALQRRFGIQLLDIPYAELRAALRKAGTGNSAVGDLYERLCHQYKMKASCSATLDNLKLHIALKELAREKKLAGFALECWTGLPAQIGMNPCLGFIEDEYITACEGDVFIAIGMLMARSITGAVPYAGDVYGVSVKNVLTLRHCGGPASLCRRTQNVVIAESSLAAKESFRAVTCRPRLNAQKVTLIRLYGQGADRMHILSGRLVASQLSQDLTVSIKLAGDRGGFLYNCYGNHYLVIGGDVAEEMEMLCEWLGIDVIRT